MDAGQFIEAISERLKQTAQIMSRRYPTVGLTADDFEQEAIATILHRFAVSSGQSPKQNDGPASQLAYNPDLAEPWTFALPIIRGAMIEAALRSAKSVEFYSPRAIKQLSEESFSTLPQNTDTDAERITALAAAVGVTLTPEESQSLADAISSSNSGPERRKGRPRRGSNTPQVVRLKRLIRDAAGEAGAAAFNK